MYCISSLKVARLAITVVEINSVTVFQVHEQSWNCGRNCWPEFQSNSCTSTNPTSLRPSLRSIHAKQTRHRIFLAQKLPEPFDFQFSIVR